MITNFWQKAIVICGNEKHTEEVPLEIQAGPSSLFYACPKYHEENRTKDERACPNRINLIEYENMLNHLSDAIFDAELNGRKINLTNLTWNNGKGIEFTVLEHKDDYIKVKALNKKAMK